MIYDEDPFRRRPRKSKARRKRQEKCVWMARKMTEWHSKRGPITNMMRSNGCNRGTVPVAVGQWYNFCEFGCHLGNAFTSAKLGYRVFTKQIALCLTRIAQMIM